MGGVPIFIDANVQFTLGERVYSLRGVDLSVGAIYGVKMLDIDPMKYVGQSVVVKAEVLAEPPFEMQLKCTAAAIVTLDVSLLEFKFEPTDDERDRLTQAIKVHGHYPNRPVRRFPRIRAMRRLATMPEHAIVETEHGLVVFSIGDISPNGIMLLTESPRAAVIVPGVPVRVQVEARGSLFNAFEFKGTVRRLELYSDPTSGNIVHAIGVRFDYFPEENKKDFLEVFRSIVQDIAKKKDFEDV